VSYTYRHSFVTDALEKGVGVAQVAELVADDPQLWALPSPGGSFLFGAILPANLARQRITYIFFSPHRQMPTYFSLARSLATC
jgi:hypothetical protein